MPIRLVRSRPFFFAGFGVFALATITQTPLFPPTRDPRREPRELAQVALPGETGVDLHEVGKLETPGLIVSLTFHQNRLYAAMAFNGLGVVNIDEPSQLRFEGRLIGLRDIEELGGRIVLDVEPIADGAKMLVCDRRRGLGVYDISNPRQPFFVRTQRTPGGLNDRAVSITTVGGYHYLSCGGGGLMSLPVGFDESTPMTPLLKNYDHTSRTTFYPPHWLLVSDGFGTGMRVMDISDPARPRLACTFQPGTYCDQIVPLGRYIVIGVRALGIMILDMANPERPRLANQTLEVTRAEVVSLELWRDRYLVVGHRAPYVDVFDLSDPERPQIVNRIGVAGPLTSMALQGDLLYAGVKEPTGLFIYQLSEFTRKK